MVESVVEVVKARNCGSSLLKYCAVVGGGKEIKREMDRIKNETL
jgi:hypothetical protein